MHGNLKEKDVLLQIREVSASQEFVVSSGPRSATQTTEKQFFFEESHDKVTFVTWNKLEETANLIMR